MGIEITRRHGATRAVLLVTLGMLAGPQSARAQAARPEEGGVKALAWMVGCWQLERGPRVTTERWSGADDMLLGTSQTTAEGRTVGWEFVRIGPGESGQVTYYAHPSGQAPAAFEMSVLTSDSVVFANPEHDFPQSITYRRRPDSLVASIGGEGSSGPQEIFFNYARTACEGPR